eukprot:2562424-Rhodomonas_salina.4
MRGTEGGYEATDGLFAVRYWDRVWRCAVCGTEIAYGASRLGRAEAEAREHVLQSKLGPTDLPEFNQNYPKSIKPTRNQSNLPPINHLFSMFCPRNVFSSGDERARAAVPVPPTNLPEFKDKNAFSVECVSGMWLLLTCKSPRPCPVLT